MGQSTQKGAKGGGLWGTLFPAHSGLSMDILRYDLVTR